MTRTKSSKRRKKGAAAIASRPPRTKKRHALRRDPRSGSVKGEMKTVDGDEELGGWISDTDWEEVCNKGKLRCQHCGYPPPIEDLQIFLDEGLCGYCAAKWQKAYEQQ